MVPACHCSSGSICLCSKDRGWPSLVGPGVSEWKGSGESSSFSVPTSLKLAVLKILQEKLPDETCSRDFTKYVGINNTVVDKVLSRDNG